MGCHALLQGVLLTQRLNLHLFSLLHWQEGPLLLEQPFSQVALKTTVTRHPWPLASSLFSQRRTQGR